MPLVEVLKFGSSVLRSPDDLPVAVDEIYRRWRSGCHVLAVVSAFEGVTDQLIRDASELFGSSSAQSSPAAYVATGEQRTAALLTAACSRCALGIPARIVRAAQRSGCSLQAPLCESAPVRVDIEVLQRLWSTHAILVLPGFYGVDTEGNTALFGRGGSDLSALFLAAELGGGCRLLKDVSGVFDADPASHCAAHRFSALCWERAIDVAGPLIQPKALRYAQSRELRFEVGRPNEHAGTAVGEAQDQSAAPACPSRPLRIALLGCGVVGRGVYEMIRRYPTAFEIRHVVVGNISRYADIENLTSDATVALSDSIDLVIECFGGIEPTYPLISAALQAGKCDHGQQGVDVRPLANSLGIRARAKASTVVLGGRGRRSARDRNTRRERIGVRDPRHHQRHLWCGVRRPGAGENSRGSHRRGPSRRIC